jgi:hypothetical protein
LLETFQLVDLLLETFQIIDLLLDKRDDELHVTLLCAVLHAG